MTDGIEINIDDAAVLLKFERINQQASHLLPLHRAIGSSFLSRINLGFRRGVDPYGQSWAPVARAGQPLRDTGRLQRSLTTQASNSQAAVGTNVIYAPVHQFGATIRPRVAPWLVFKVGGKWVKTKKVNIKPRPFMPIVRGNILLPQAWKDSALNAVKNHLGV